MSTRSIINRTYCQSDGDIKGAGMALIRHFNTKEKVLEISAHPTIHHIEADGSIRFLRKDENPIYWRTNTTTTPPLLQDDHFSIDGVERLLKSNQPSAISYIYEYENEEWWVTDLSKNETSRKRERLAEKTKSLKHSALEG